MSEYQEATRPRMAGRPGICPRCGRPFRQKATGRPRTWCSMRCKWAATKAAEKVRQRNALAAVRVREPARPVYAEPDPDLADDPVCRVCQERRATIAGMLCEACARA